MNSADSRALVRDVLKGAATSVIASCVMGAFLEFANESGAFGEAAPRRLTRHLLSVVGVPLNKPALHAPTTALHLAYAIAAGAASGPLLQRLPTGRARLTGGIAVGATLGAISYAGLNPSVRWMPRHTRELPRSRPWRMLGAHLIFGSLLGALHPSTR